MLPMLLLKKHHQKSKLDRAAFKPWACTTSFGRLDGFIHGGGEGAGLYLRGTITRIKTEPFRNEL